VLGPTGVGKSFVACALAQKACRYGYSTLYTRAQSLFRDLAMARADGSLRSLLSRLSRIDVLVIDDWAMAPLSEPERRDFWEIRGPLPNALDDPHFATAGLALA
jgi:DNA replication protein DnaC